MMTFDEFRDAVVTNVAVLSSSTRGQAEDSVYRAQQGGVFNDYYGFDDDEVEPEPRTDEEAARVAGYIVRTLQQSAEFMRNAMAGEPWAR